MNPVFQALNSGYAPEKILEFLTKSIPQLGHTIHRAKSAGYTVQQILGFLAKTSSEGDTRGLSDPEIRARNRQTEANMVKNGLTMTAGALGSLAAGRVAYNALSRSPLAQSTRGMPNAPGTSHMPHTTTSPISQVPQQTAPQTPSANITPSSQTPQISPSQTPQQQVSTSTDIVAQTAKTINPKEILDKTKSTAQVQTLLDNGNDPNQVGGYFRKFHQNIVDQIEKESGKPFEDVISEYAKEQPQKIKTSVPEEEIVITPSGQGKIKEISGDHALVEEDGKLKQHKLDTIIESIIPEKDIAELYEDLIKGIEKHTGKPVSRNVESAGYDPTNNELVYKPHGSDKFYIYDDISPEDVKLLTSLLTKRKSTGENFIGAWESGTESPIGAAMYQLIKKLQAERGGKGNEYKNKFETIYDALEPAKEALKRKYEEAKKKAKKSRTH